MTLPPLAFLDTETTGLDTFDHIWDIAVILRYPGEPDIEHQWFVEHDQNRALRLPDPFLSDYHFRYDPATALNVYTTATRIRALLEGAVVIGAVPGFDTLHMETLMRAAEHKKESGWSAPWHYQTIDVEALVLGALAFTGADHIPTPPWSSDTLNAMVGVDADLFPRHTAMGDARWARATFDAVNPWPAYRRFQPAA